MGGAGRCELASTGRYVYRMVMATSNREGDGGATNARGVTDGAQTRGLREGW